MRVSTRSRYGVRLMLVLARNYGKGYFYLKDIARGEGISEKYLSQIAISLRDTGLLNSSRGARGGYTLTKAPAQITLKEIVDVLEGGTSLVDCVKDKSVCARSPICASRDVWVLLGEKISEALASINLEQLLRLKMDKIEDSLSPRI
ncbi:MAG: Rrf2 family transcriptional regulator [Syntrophobacterales bacterium]|nr:Rrf2 family transcriptional regulator [Syntrophobacterales bacterium]